MLSVDFEFYKGVLFVRLKGIFTKYSLGCNDFSSLIDYIGFKYIVFNISKIRQIDVYAIDYLINYSKKLLFCNQKSFICLNEGRLANKFINNVEVITRENEVLNKI